MWCGEWCGVLAWCFTLPILPVLFVVPIDPTMKLIIGLSCNCFGGLRHGTQHAPFSVMMNSSGRTAMNCKILQTTIGRSTNTQRTTSSESSDRSSHNTQPLGHSCTRATDWALWRGAHTTHCARTNTTTCCQLRTAAPHCIHPPHTNTFPTPYAVHRAYGTTPQNPAQYHCTAPHNAASTLLPYDTEHTPFTLMTYYHVTVYSIISHNTRHCTLHTPHAAHSRTPPHTATPHTVTTHNTTTIHYTPHATRCTLHTAHQCYTLQALTYCHYCHTTALHHTRDTHTQQ